MQITTAYAPKSSSERNRRMRERNGSQGRAKNAQRMRNIRKVQVPEFICVDSEGIGKGKNHRAVLLGIGDAQYVARNTNVGLQWREVFEFLYSQYKAHPRAAFTGFYLKYDFDHWLSIKAGMPREKGFMLFSERGKAIRKVTTKNFRRRKTLPVRLDGWEFDLMGYKRLSIRPIADGCKCGIPGEHCDLKKHNGWMNICDAGTFFQAPFLDVIKPSNWKDDPRGPVCTEEEYRKVEIGKGKRDSAHLDDDMKFYNRLENIIFARVMTRLAQGFNEVGIRLSKDMWYGPGAAASRWLGNNGIVKREEAEGLIPHWMWDACRMSYYGGWFEIFSHGLMLETSYNYDINNAYPYASAQLPHICKDCQYKRGSGSYAGTGNYVLLYCTVFSKSDRIGPVPYREKDGSILRPSISRGWYWKHELDAANRAGLVKEIKVQKWHEFIPCSHPKPMRDIEKMYYKRLEVGKYSAVGMAIKATICSVYGKAAQSVGEAPYNNWLYASLITSQCRTQILDAIATHPRKASAVLMVATDGICFDSPNPNLPVSKKLGEWDYTEYFDLCLFKPGVYWHRDGKTALAKLKVKSRGVPKAEFTKAIERMEFQFRAWHETKSIPGSILVRHKVEDKYSKWNKVELRDRSDIELPQYYGILEWEFFGQRGWPHFLVPVKFRVKSCKQAINEGHWESSAEVLESIELLQSSDPENKRQHPKYNRTKRRVDTYIRETPRGQWETTYHGEASYPKPRYIGGGLDGDATEVLLEGFTTLRGKAPRYDLPINEADYEWTTIWDGGVV